MVELSQEELIEVYIETSYNSLRIFSCESSRKISISATNRSSSSSQSADRSITYNGSVLMCSVCGGSDVASYPSEEKTFRNHDQSTYSV